MPLITITDLKTHLYPEIIEVITRTDNDIVTRCIADAEAMAKSYLSRFDLLSLFGDATTLAAIDDPFLRRVITDIAVWFLIKLSNPNVRLELHRTNYEDAMAWLKSVQSGKADPDGWLQKVDDPDTDIIEGAQISFTSNPKQNHHF